MEIIERRSGNERRLNEFTVYCKRVGDAYGLEGGHSKTQNEYQSKMVFYKYLLENIAEGILVMDKDDRIFFINDPMVKIAGIQRGQLLGRVVLRNFSEGTLKEFKFYYLKAKESLDKVSYDSITVMTPAGKMTYQSGILLPLVNNGHFDGMICTIFDNTKRKQEEEARKKLISELQQALSKVKTLSGLLPICVSCKKIRDDKGYWNQIESYIRDHSSAEFSHGICPECAIKIYPDFYN
jgi:PAS domain S-box-containing protein